MKTKVASFTQDGWYEVTLSVLFGRIAKRLGLGQPLSRLIDGQYVGQIERVSERNDVARVELCKLLHIVDDPREVLGHRVQMFVLDLQTCQEGDFADVVARETHFFAFAAAGPGAAAVVLPRLAFPLLSIGNTNGLD